MRNLVLLSLVVGFVGMASGDQVLWNQSNYDINAVAFVDQEFPDFPTYSTYQVHDFVTTGSWNINTVSTYFTYMWAGNWTGVTQARLNLFTKTGVLPNDGTDLPQNGTVVPITKSVIAGEVWKITANTTGMLNGLNGMYWIGLTPIAAFGTYGQEFHMCVATQLLDPSAARNPGNGFGLGTNWGNYTMFGYPAADGAILLEGVPEPATLLLLGVAGLLIRRR